MTAPPVSDGAASDSAATPRAGWRSRLVPADEAARHVPSGSHVFVGGGCATPRTVIRALESFECPARDLVLLHFLTHGAIPITPGGLVTRFRHRVFYVGADMSGIADSAALEYVPASLLQVHALIESRRLPVDVAVIQVTPPDEHGQCSLGVSIGLALIATARAKTVIAEINPNLPRTVGDTSISIDRIHHLVEVDEPVTEFTYRPADEVGRQIARYVARIIDDGATLHVGLGRISNETLRYLTNRHDLGIHTGVITEPLVDLIESGVVTGARKSVHRRQVVASYCMGTRRLYDLVDRNPAFNFQPVDYVCNPGIIGANRNLVSVTEAYAVDLTGQVCTDRDAGHAAGGLATRPEFLRGAAASAGGKAIICLAATSDDGHRSRLKAQLGADEGASVPRSEVHYVVTEYGVAYLYGRSLSERALALIEIAHPDFRADLLDQAKGLGHVHRDQTLKSRTAYPAEEERRITLKDGHEVLLRPTHASDVDGMRALFYGMSDSDVYTRFFTNLTSFSTSKAQHLCSVSYDGEMAFVAVSGPREHEKVVGSGCYYVDPATRLANVAYMVRSEWKGLGLGSALQQRLTEYAKARGVRGFSADVLVENEAMIKVLEKSGCRISKRTVGPTYEIEMLFDEDDVATCPLVTAATAHPETADEDDGEGNSSTAEARPPSPVHRPGAFAALKTFLTGRRHA